MMKRFSLVRLQRVFTYALCALLILLCSSEMVAAEDDWAVTVYGARFTDSVIARTLRFSADFVDSYLLAIAVERRIATFKKHIDFEVEVQAVKHFGDQHHLEFNGLIIARWLTFPWDKYINTSFAVGEGISYATEVPELERLYHRGEKQILNYLLFEITLSCPNLPKWSLVARSHHRSNAYGLFAEHGGSNSMGLGVKYSF